LEEPKNPAEFAGTLHTLDSVPHGVNLLHRQVHLHDVCELCGVALGSPVGKFLLMPLIFVKGFTVEVIHRERSVTNHLLHVRGILFGPDTRVSGTAD
jgi:hypothetical protein